jgi:hypothetical protein
MSTIKRVIENPNKSANDTQYRNIRESLKKAGKILSSENVAVGVLEIEKSDKYIRLPNKCFVDRYDQVVIDIVDSSIIRRLKRCPELNGVYDGPFVVESVIGSPHSSPNAVIDVVGSGSGGSLETHTGIGNSVGRSHLSKSSLDKVNGSGNGSGIDVGNELVYFVIWHRKLRRVNREFEEDAAFPRWLYEMRLVNREALFLRSLDCS